MRDTSIASYVELKPYIADSHAMIMDVMINRPDKDDWTMREVRQEIIDLGILPKDECLSSSISGRLNEMQKEGFVEECGKRECEISGRTCITRRLRLTNYKDWQNEQIERERIEHERAKWAKELFTV